MNPRAYAFVGANAGDWAVERQQVVTGEALPIVSHVSMLTLNQIAGFAGGMEWALRGVTSNERYVERSEKATLVAQQEGLGREQARCAALIPIRKNAAWWQLTQDERRNIFQEQSRHIDIGLRYLPEIARRLHHCRDLEADQGFDFLTWFEFAPEYESIFDDMLAELRASPEWRYVDREIDLRLRKIL